MITKTSDIFEDSSFEISDSPQKLKGNKTRTRMAFENEISLHMKKSIDLAEKNFEEIRKRELAAQQRHEDRMQLLREIFLKK